MITSSYQQPVDRGKTPPLSTGNKEQTPSVRCLRIEEALAYAGLSRTMLYRLMVQKKIKVRKAGSATLIEKESLDRYLDDLPGFEPRKHQSA